MNITIEDIERQFEKAVQGAPGGAVEDAEDWLRTNARVITARLLLEAGRNRSTPPPRFTATCDIKAGDIVSYHQGKLCVVPQHVSYKQALGRTKRPKTEIEKSADALRKLARLAHLGPALDQYNPNRQRVKVLPKYALYGCAVSQGRDCGSEGYLIAQSPIHFELSNMVEGLNWYRIENRHTGEVVQSGQDLKWHVAPLPRPRYELYGSTVADTGVICAASLICSGDDLPTLEGVAEDLKWSHIKDIYVDWRGPGEDALPASKPFPLRGPRGRYELFAPSGRDGNFSASVAWSSDLGELKERAKRMGYRWWYILDKQEDTTISSSNPDLAVPNVLRNGEDRPWEGRES